MQWYEYIIPAISGLVACIPLVLKLIQYVQAAVKEKNWSKLLDIVMGYMETAEKMFDNGADRKQWVLAMVKSSADTINFDIDMDTVSQLIDTLCGMSKVVNNPKTTN